MMWLVLIPVAFAAAAAEEGGLQVLWRFDSGITNDLGGGYNGWSRGEAKAIPRIRRGAGRGGAGAGMDVEYRVRKGEAGVWMHLFDSRAPADGRLFVDATAMPFLSFWIRGKRGNENPSIRLADAAWFARDDAVRVGRVRDVLPGGITTNWQEVVIPLAGAGVDPSSLASISWMMEDEGEGGFVIDDLALKSAPDTPVPLSTKAYPATSDRLRLALWVWSSERVLTDPVEQKRFLRFCREQKVTDLYMQLTPACGVGDPADADCPIRYPEEWAGLIRACSGSGMKVHALEGRPDYVLATWHSRLLSLVRAVVAYNESCAPAERFAGIRFDNEPYLLAGFHGPDRAGMIKEWLDGNLKVMGLVRSLGADLEVGVDIPFWLDESEDPVIRDFRYAGKSQPVAFHLIDLVDQVTLMDYRDTAGGMDGIIAHGRGEVDHAARTGKPVLLGVETFSYPPRSVTFAGSMSADDHRKSMAEGPLAGNYLWDSFRIRTVSAGRRVWIGLMHDAELEPGAAELSGALASLGDSLARLQPAANTPENVEGVFRESVVRDPELSNVRRSGPWLTVDIRMLDKVTFAEETRRDVELAFEETSQAFEGHRGFGGFAVHYYETWRDLPAGLHQDAASQAGGE